VTAGFGLDLDAVLTSADDSVLNILLGLRKDNDGRLVRKSEVVRLDELSVVAV
jgi:hypothetical protein